MSLDVYLEAPGESKAYVETGWVGKTLRPSFRHATWRVSGVARAGGDTNNG